MVSNNVCGSSQSSSAAVYQDLIPAKALEENFPLLKRKPPDYTTGSSYVVVMPQFSKKSTISASQEELFRYHMSPGALHRLIPPWEDIQVLSQTTPGVTQGSEVQLQVPLGPGVAKVWHARHTELTAPESFTDQQLSGPFARWIHQHRFRAKDEKSELSDEIDYQLPLHPLSTLVADWFVQQKLERTFHFRHQRTAADLTALRFLNQSCGGGNPCPPKTVLVTGGTGLVGRNLIAFLHALGHTPLTVSRSPSDDPNQYQWDIEAGVFPYEALERADAVIHLAGEGIAEKRWSAAQKQRIRESRVAGTRLLVQSIAEVRDRPEVLISASATGYYGDRGDEELTEASSPGDAFTSTVAIEWEEEAQRAESLGLRTIFPRIGIVLTPEGGALRKMLLPFQCGVAGKLGSGQQWMSCIFIDDLVYGLSFLLENSSCEGAYNMVTPSPEQNVSFTKALGSVLHRPTPFPVPAPLLRLALGELAEELLLASTRVFPERLLQAGYQFTFPNIPQGLAFVLGKDGGE
ncbi:TIGR01777 family oxidoreductase [bacterium]|nr:TIGR01777 family oxidoreductase [bacterium]